MFGRGRNNANPRYGQGYGPGKSKQPTKLGVENVGSSATLRNASPAKNSTSIYLLLVFLTLCGVAGLAVYFVTSGNGDSNVAGSGTTAPTSVPEISFTPYPTNTPRPTNYPTEFPTTSVPTTPTTASPTFSVTPAPSTKAPTSGTCENEDAVCGCNAVVSQLLDIMWMVDESGSIGLTNYQLTRTAIFNYINSTDYGENGTRHGLLEFNHDVNEVINFNEYETKEDFLSSFMLSYASSGTDQQGAIEFFHDTYLEEPGNEAREGSQLVIIMLTDGNPCVTGGCPSSELPELNPVPQLNALAQDYNFTFIFIPLSVDPFCGTCAQINLDLFDTDNADCLAFPQASTCDNGLVFNETYIKLPLTGFDNLDSLLKSSVEIPLGPCVPSSSQRRRRLRDAEAGAGDATASQRAQYLQPQF